MTFRSDPRKAAVLVTAALMACGSASEDPERGSTLTVLVNGAAASQMRLYELKYLLFLPLGQQDGVEVVPRLARSWEHSPDYRSWTFHLRDDVRWHDGMPVTAHDVAFTFELSRRVLFPGGTSVDSTIVLSDHSITVTLKEPVSYPPVFPWTVYFPRHLLQDLDPAEFYEWEFWDRPVGNGPYRLVRHVPQTALEFQANPDFYAGEPPIQTVIARLGSANPVIELTSGVADAATNLKPADLLKLEADPRFETYYLNDWTELYLIYWNHHHPLFTEASARRALEHAIDRRELARLIRLPEQIPLVGGLGNDGGLDPDRRRGWDRVPDYDPQRAELLLEEAGWVDRDADGTRGKDGHPARFTLMVPQSGSIAALSQGVFIQDQLRRVGVGVEILPLEMGVVRERLRSGDFEAGIIWENQDAHTILWTWFGGPADPGASTGDPSVPFGYYDAEAARLLEGVLATPDPAVHDTLYARFNEILRRDSPVMLLFPGVYRFAAHRRIRGFREGWDWLNHPDQLWIEDEP